MHTASVFDAHEAWDCQSADLGDGPGVGNLQAIAKLRINFQLNADGKTLTGTTEAVLLDRDGKVISTFPGATNSAVRLSAERPGDFDAFQTEQ